MNSTTRNEIAPVPGQRLRHKPTGRTATFVKDVYVTNHRYLLCLADDRKAYYCYAISNWEEIEDP
jgi:hypothetical protein